MLLVDLCFDENSFVQFWAYVYPKLDLLNMKADFLNRNVNEGFSGGERKRNEILQLAVGFTKFIITFKKGSIL